MKLTVKQLSGIRLVLTAIHYVIAVLVSAAV